MGTKYAAYATDPGPVIGFYDSDDSPVPAGVKAIEITEQEWQAAISGGYTVSAKTLTAPAPLSSAEILAAAKVKQGALIDAAYWDAVSEDISFTSQGGVTTNYQADATSRNTLLESCFGYTMAGAAPEGSIWKASDNTLTPFVLDDFKGLYAAMLTRGKAAFDQRTALKAQIEAAADLAAVQAITWASGS